MRTTGIIFGAVLLGLWVPASLAKWGPATNLTPGSLGGSWTTSNNARGLACRGDTVFLVWHDFRASPRNYGCFLYFKIYDGTAWSADSIIGMFYTTRFHNWNASCALDDAGRLHVVWESNDINYPNSGDYDIVYRRREGGAWTAPIRLTSHPLYSWYPSIACQPGGRLDVFWQDSRDGAFRIWHRVFDGSAWQAEYCIDTLAQAAGLPSAASFQGRPAVAWQDFRTGVGQIFFRKMGPSGWEADSAVSHSSAGAYCPCLASDQAGNLHLAWEDFQDGNSEIYYRRLEAATQVWGPVVRVTYEPSHSRQPTVVCRGDSLADLFWADDRDGNYEIYRVQVKNGSWGQEQRLTFQAAFSLAPSAAADDRGDLHLAWTDQRGNPGYSPDIYYMKYTAGPSGISGDGSERGGLSELLVSPNPTSGPISVSFNLGGAAARPMWLSIYSITGQRVFQKRLDMCDAGPGAYNWRGNIGGRGLAAGVYLASISDGQQALHRKFILLR